MALTISDVTTAVSTSAGATLDVTSITAAVGDLLILAVAADNAGASGASSTSATITDSAGNTWTRQSETNRTGAGAANDGTTLSIWTSLLGFALSSATITVNFSPDTTAKVAALKKAVPDAGQTVGVIAVGAGATGSAAGQSAGAVSVAEGQTIVGFVALESSNAVTGDGDTANGSWSSEQTDVANAGTTTTSQRIGGQHKTVTATGSQTYNTTSSSARDYAINYLVIAAQADATLAVTEAADAADMAADVAWTATLEATEAADTADMAADAAWTVTLEATEAADTAELAADVAWTVDLAATEASDVAAFAAAVAWEPVLAATEEADTASASIDLETPAESSASAKRSARILVEVTWPTEVVSRHWDGSGPFVDDDGNLWTGAGAFSGLDAVEQALNGEAATLSIVLSGVPSDAADLAWTAYTRDQIVGGIVRLLVQQLDAADDRPVGEPEVFFTGTIDNFVDDQVVADDEGAKVTLSTLAVEVVNRFAMRRIPSGRVLSDTDQKARSAILNPGADPDRFAEHVPLMADRSIQWPRFS